MRIVWFLRFLQKLPSAADSSSVGSTLAPTGALTISWNPHSDKLQPQGIMGAGVTNSGLHVDSLGAYCEPEGASSEQLPPDKHRETTEADRTTWRSLETVCRAELKHHSADWDIYLHNSRQISPEPTPGHLQGSCRLFPGVPGPKNWILF